MQSFGFQKGKTLQTIVKEETIEVLKSEVPTIIQSEVAVIQTRLESRLSEVEALVQAANRNAQEAKVKAMSAQASACGSSNSVQSYASVASAGVATKRQRAEREPDAFFKPAHDTTATHTIANGKVLVTRGVIRLVCGGLKKEWKRPEAIKKLRAFLESATRYTAGMPKDQKDNAKDSKLGSTDLIDLILRETEAPGSDIAIQTRGERANHGFFRLKEEYQVDLNAVFRVTNLCNTYGKHMKENDKGHEHASMWVAPEKPAAERQRSAKLTAAATALKKIMEPKDRPCLDVVYSKYKLFWEDDAVAYISMKDNLMYVNPDATEEFSRATGVPKEKLQEIVEEANS
jgi:hypothetical protein